MKNHISLLFIIFITNISFSQIFSNQSLSPNGVFEKIYDRYGNNYFLDDIKIDTSLNEFGVQKSVFICSSGYFNLYFENGSGMETNSAIQTERRNVICQLFTDLSGFIIPADPNVVVNIWVRDISTSIPNPSTSGVLGLASGFHVLPSNAPGFTGISDNEIWKTINSGTDSYTNVSSPLITANGSNGNFYHGMIAINFSNPALNWHTDLSLVTSSGFYDLYSVALHEATHALGFASLIDENGNSKFGTDYQYFARYDLFLQTQANEHLLTNSGP